jgi:lysozyme
MSESNAALHDRLEAAWADIVDRLNEANLPAEIASLTAARDQLRMQVDLATQGQLGDAAGAVAKATKALQDVVNTAGTDPIQQFVGLIKDHIAALDAISPGAAAPPPPRRPRQARAPAPPAAEVPAPPAAKAAPAAGPNHALAFAEAIVQHWEGCSLTPYHGKADRPEVWTIGWGCINIGGVPVGPNTPAITQARADELLANELAGSQAAVKRQITVALTDYQEAALISFTYNLGEPNLQSSTLRTLLNGGHTNAAAAEFGQWVMSAGQRVKGLIRRRGAERAVFEGKVPFGTRLGATLDQFADAALADGTA